MEDGAHLRLMVTRGRKATINQDPRFTLGAPTIAVTAEFKRREATARPLARAQSSIRTSTPEIFDMHLNTHSRLNYIGALLDVMDTGADEAIMLEHRGFVASCNATNLFWVKDGTVFTSRDDFCFNGITRGNVIALCRNETTPLQQGDWLPDHLFAADHVFVTGMMGGVTTVGSLDGRDPTAPPGPVTKAPLSAFRSTCPSWRMLGARNCWKREASAGKIPHRSVRSSTSGQMRLTERLSALRREASSRLEIPTARMRSSPRRPCPIPSTRASIFGLSWEMRARASMHKSRIRSCSMISSGAMTA
jgi:hypothetical protein